MKRTVIFLVLVVIASMAWYLARPLFMNDHVSEDLPEDFSDYQFPITEESVSTPKAEEEVFEAGKMPEVFLSGSFEDADNFHKGSGDAKIIKNRDNYLLRLENFEVTNGPDLYVVLSPDGNPTDHDSLGDYADLGRLKGNVGNQNYSLDGIDVSKYKSVVIYCKAFSVIFSVATLN